MQRMPDDQTPLWIMLLCAAWLCAGVAGCGAPAAPLPPTLNLPQPIHDLAVARIGDEVQATFTVPAKTTDKLPVRGAMTAILCRSIASGSCQPVQRETIPDRATTVSMSQVLPPELLQGDRRLLIYKVKVLNRLGKTAGDSNASWTVSGAASPAITGLTATPQRGGIVLSWQSLPGGQDSIHFERKASLPPGARAEAGEDKETGDQSFKVPERPSSGRVSAIDSMVTTALPGITYRYVAQRITSMKVDGHTVQLASLPSPAVAVDYRDIYPPPVPAGLVSAPDSADKAIDLNWTPDVDPGLSGYFVYRRLAGSPGAPERVSPPGTPVRTSSWRDTTALPGQRYAYSVSAVDTSGNESQRSAEVEDEWSADVVPAAAKP